MNSEVRRLNITVELLRMEILNAKLQSPEASSPKATSSVIDSSISQAAQSQESSVRQNRTYTFDEPMTFTPLSPPPRRKLVTCARSTPTL